MLGRYVSEDNRGELLTPGEYPAVDLGVLPPLDIGVCPVDFDFVLCPTTRAAPELVLPAAPEFVLPAEAPEFVVPRARSSVASSGRGSACLGLLKFLSIWPKLAS